MRFLCPFALVLAFFALFFYGTAFGQTPEADALQSTLLTKQGDDAVKQKNNQEALTFYTKATELNTKNGAAWTRLGRLTYAMGDGDKAKSFLKEGWACGDIGALRTLAGLAMLEGNNTDFQDLLPDLLKQKDSSVEIRAMLILYYKKIGKMTSENIEPVLAGMDLKQLASVSKENLTLLQQGYEALGRSQEVSIIETELSKRGTSP